MVVHVCCKCLLPIFHLCFPDTCCKCVYLDVAYVSHIRCMCFIWKLCMVAMVFKCFQMFFQVFQKHVSSVLTAFRRMCATFVFRCFKSRSNVAFLLPTFCCIVSLDVGRASITSREQTFHPRSKWALVPIFFAPGTRETFSPGLQIQPGLKVPSQRLLRQAFTRGDLQSWLELPTGTKG